MSESVIDFQASCHHQAREEQILYVQRANLLYLLRYGVILWELLTNEEPWQDKTAMQVTQNLLFVKKIQAMVPTLLIT